MDFIQRKTVDQVVESYLAKAAEEGLPLTWDRFEGQLPECGFCETGLSCRDCLQGPCISNPFRESNKVGICGKDRDDLAAQSFLRLTLKGAISYLDQAAEFSRSLASGNLKANDQAQLNAARGELERLLGGGESGRSPGFPPLLADNWQGLGIGPEGTTRDIFRAFQMLEGGTQETEELILRGFKAALLACGAARLQGRMKQAAFGYTVPTAIDVNFGVLRQDCANVLLVGNISPLLKRNLLAAAKARKINVAGVATDILLPPYVVSPATTFASQEIPFLTGAVDLAVVGDQQANPSLAAIAKASGTPLINPGSLNGADPAGLVETILDKAEKSFALRGKKREIPEVVETAVVGFSEAQLPAAGIIAGLAEGKIKGIVIVSGSGNVKFIQDRPTVIMVEEFLKRDILCLSVGEASVTLAKYGFLNPAEREKHCGAGLFNFLSGLGRDIPSVIDLGRSENGAIIELLGALIKTGKKPLSAYPIAACFPEANRTSEVVEALWYVAHGITTYFWPAFPVTGSPKVVSIFDHFLKEKFGASLPIQTEKKVEPLDKAGRILSFLKVEGARIITKGGQVWEKN